MTIQFFPSKSGHFTELWSHNGYFLGDLDSKGFTPDNESSNTFTSSDLEEILNYMKNKTPGGSE